MNAPAAAVKSYLGYIFDLDGTIYLGDELLPGAHRLITELRARAARTVFLSNNPTRDRQMYATKLSALGLPTPLTDILNTVVTMVAWLEKHAPQARVFVIGEQPLRRAIAEAGFELCEDPEQIDVVVASYDREFNYPKLQIAFDALWRHRRAILVTTNPDAYCPFPGGRGEPDSAAIVAAIEACTGVRCSANVGKPDPIMLETVLGVIGLAAQDCIMVGDRLYTDIRMGRAGGMDTALVLTGETTRDMLGEAAADERPTYVLDSIDQLLESSTEPPTELSR